MATKLKLSLTERIILANQLRILKAVDRDEAKYYQHQRDALERGYELEYAELATAFSDDGLSEVECDEVYDILEMHRALHFDQRELPDDAGISAADVRSGGSTATTRRSTWPTRAIHTFGGQVRRAGRFKRVQ